MRLSDFVYPPTIARCQHIKVNGVQCGSPALKNRKLCHFHQRWQQGRIQLNANRARRSRYSLDLPILEDANSIQVALMQGLRLLLTNQVDHKTAALLFYALQTASTNLSRTTLEPRPQQVVIDPRRTSATSLGDDAWYKEEFTEAQPEDTETNQKPAERSPTTVDIHAMAESGHAAVPSTKVACNVPRSHAIDKIQKRSRPRRHRTASSTDHLIQYGYRYRLPVDNGNRAYGSTSKSPPHPVAQNATRVGHPRE